VWSQFKGTKTVRAGIVREVSNSTMKGRLDFPLLKKYQKERLF
jgi:hypothetical protein